jgi:hypothetical protein
MVQMRSMVIHTVCGNVACCFVWPSFSLNSLLTATVFSRVYLYILAVSLRIVLIGTCVCFAVAIADLMLMTELLIALG